VGPFLADDQPRPLRPALEAVAVEFGDQAPPRISPPGSTAGVHAVEGTSSTAWWMASVMVMPTE
jgi:hypothetical protein